MRGTEHFDRTAEGGLGSVCVTVGAVRQLREIPVKDGARGRECFQYFSCQPY
jgi:hypothetical protein